jgi:hypothetical protein
VSYLKRMKMKRRQAEESPCLRKTRMRRRMQGPFCLTRFVVQTSNFKLQSSKFKLKLKLLNVLLLYQG